MSLERLKKEIDNYNHDLGLLMDQEKELTHTDNATYLPRYTARGGYSNMVNSAEEVIHELFQWNENDFSAYEDHLKSLKVPEAAARKQVLQFENFIDNASYMLGNEIDALSEEERQTEAAKVVDPNIDRLGWDLIQTDRQISKAVSEIVKAADGRAGLDINDAREALGISKIPSWGSENIVEQANQALRDLKNINEGDIFQKMMMVYSIMPTEALGLTADLNRAISDGRFTLSRDLNDIEKARAVEARPQGEKATTLEKLKAEVDQYNIVLGRLRREENQLPNETYEESPYELIEAPFGGYGGSMTRFSEQAKEFVNNFNQTVYADWLINRSEGGISKEEANRFALRVYNSLNWATNRMTETAKNLTLSDREVDLVVQEQNEDVNRLGSRIIIANDRVNQAISNIEDALNTYADPDDDSLPMLPDGIPADDFIWKSNESALDFTNRIIETINEFTGNDGPADLKDQLVNRFSVPEEEAEQLSGRLLYEMASMRSSLMWARDRVLEDKTPDRIIQEAAVHVEKPPVFKVLDQFDSLQDSINEYTAHVLNEHGLKLEFDKKGDPYIDVSMQVPGFANGTVEARQYIPNAGPSDSTKNLNIYDLKRIPEGIVTMAEEFNPVMYANFILDSAHSLEPRAIEDAYNNGVSLKKALDEVSANLSSNLGIELDSWNLDLDLNTSIKQSLIASQTFVVPRDIFEEVDGQGTDWEAMREYNQLAINSLNFMLERDHVTMLGEDEIETVLYEDGFLANGFDNKALDQGYNDEALVRDLANGIRELANAKDVLSDGNLLKWDKVQDSIIGRMNDYDKMLKAQGLEGDFLESYETHKTIDNISMSYPLQHEDRTASIAVGFEEPVVFDRIETPGQLVGKLTTIENQITFADNLANRNGIIDTGGIEGQGHVQEFMSKLSNVAFESSITYGPDRNYPWQDEVIAQRKAKEQAVSKPVQKPEPSVFTACEGCNPISIVEEAKKRHQEAVMPKNDRNKNQNRNID